MNRTTGGVAVLVVLLISPATAGAAGGSEHDRPAGHDALTKKLERGFTASLSARVVAKNGCYPPPRNLAAIIRKHKGLPTGVARGPKATAKRGVVYVLTRGTSCNSLRLAVRQGRRTIYVLDTVRGDVRVLGKKRSKEKKKRLIAQNKGPLRALTLATRSFKLKRDHRRQRLVAHCPGKTLPLGGGLMTTRGLDPDGEGVFPHSYERLGTQRGWHSTAWLRNPTKRKRTSRVVTLQVMCGRGLAPMSAPRRSVFTRRNTTRAVTAHCQRRQYLMSGGYQRTNFLGDGGNYITESRAVSPRAWRVSARAYGRYAGELTAIAYCVKASGPLLSEVSASTPLPYASIAEVRTPPCPDGWRLTSGGFSANGSHRTWFAGGWFTEEGGWAVAGHGRFGGARALTAYGYCLQEGV